MLDFEAALLTLPSLRTRSIGEPQLTMPLMAHFSNCMRQVTMSREYERVGQQAARANLRGGRAEGRDHFLERVLEVFSHHLIGVTPLLSMIPLAGVFNNQFTFMPRRASSSTSEKLVGRMQRLMANDTALRTRPAISVKGKENRTA